MREYSFLEFSCNNSLHVAGNTSTFRLQCPPTGQFPTVHERPVLEDGNYSARFLSGVELETKVCVDFTITEKAPTRAFFRLKAPTSAFIFKTLLRHYG